MARLAGRSAVTTHCGIVAAVTPIRLVEGFTMCPCGTWVRDEVAARTEGLCTECRGPVFASQLETIQVVTRGATIQVRRNPRRPRPGRQYTQSRRHRRALAGQARDAARRRLAELVPDLYDALLAEERERRGLEPWPVEMALRGRPASVDIDIIERFRAAKGT